MKINYGGLLDHYCPLSSRLLSLAAGAAAVGGAPTTNEQPHNMNFKTVSSNNIGPEAAAGGEIEDCQQPTQVTHEEEPPLSLKEIITQLVSQGKLTNNQAS